MAESYIGLAEPSTITKSLRTVTHNIAGSSGIVHQEVMTLGGAGSSLQLAAVVASPPVSTEFGLGVRIISGPSSAADLTVRVNQGLGISSLADRWPVFTANSSAADFVPVRIVDSSGTGFAPLGLDYTDASTASTLAAPSLTYNNGSNTTMRLVGVTQPFPVQIRTGTLAFASTTALITSTHSTALYSLVSSAAGVRHKVTAYFVGSTHTVPSTLVFVSSNGQDLWAINFGSGSSGVTGANLAKNAPDFFFATETAAALNVRIEGGSSATSTVVARVSISYFTE